jgi:hypothetical protein
MQITARKPRFSPVNIRYAAAALGIAGALAAGVVAYTVTRDDSQASQPIAAAPVTEQYTQMADENALGGSPAGPAPAAVAQDRPALREGFQATGPSEDVTSNRPTDRGVSSGTTHDTLVAQTPIGAGEGFLGGNETADLSYLAPEVRSYADILFAEQNWVTDSATAGMLDDEYSQPNPGVAH